MEEISLANDAARDARAAERLRLLRAESASLAAEQSALTKAWEAEKGRMEAVGLRPSLNKIRMHVRFQCAYLPRRYSYDAVSC